MHFFGHCQLLCYSTANVVESSYGLDNLEVTNHANSSMENDVMMLMQLATCKLCFSFCQGPREAMARLRVMLMGLSPSWTMQPFTLCAS